MKSRRVFVGLWTATLLLKLWLAAAIPPYADEVFYWLEGRQLAWAYSDLPGLAAWLTRVGTMIAGDTPFGLRWPFLLLAAGLPWLAVRIARRWFGEEAGWQAGCYAMVLPLATIAGVLAVPDVPLLFATLLAFDACAALLERVDKSASMELALALAIGALSHYRFAIALFAGAVAMLASAPGRAALRKPAVLAALAFGALAWLPLAWFNWTQQGAGLRFQVVDRNPWAFHLRGLELQLAQPVFTGPLLYAALLWTLWQAWRRRADPRWRLLLCASGLPIAIFIGFSPFVDVERVSFHWPLSAYLPLLACLPWLLHEGGHARARTWIVATNAALCLALFAYTGALASSSSQQLLARMGLFTRPFAGWNEVAAATRQRLAAMPAGTVVVADNFILAAELEFAMEGRRRVPTFDHPVNAKHGRAVQLALWQRDEGGFAALAGHPVLVVVADNETKEEHRDAWLQHLCDVLPGLRDDGRIDVDGRRLGFTFYRRDPDAAQGCVMHPAQGPAP